MTRAEHFWSAKQNPELLIVAAGMFAAEVLAIWPGPLLLEYFLANTTRQHAWYAWLSACKADIQDAGKMRTHLTTSTNRVLLREAFGSVPPGLIGALGRLGLAALPSPLYCGLHTILSDGGDGAKFIMHSRTLKPATIQILAALPKCLRLKHITKFCSVQRAQLLGWLIDRLGLPTDELPHELQSKITRAVNYPELESILLTHGGHKRSFPAAPVDVKGPIRPIESRACLMDAAREFANCLGGYLDEIYDGRSYFYILEGEEPAVIGLRRLFPLEHWAIDQIGGKRNADVSAKTRETIAAGFAHAPWVYSGMLLDDEND